MTMNMPARAAGAIPDWRLADRLRRAREFAGLEQTELSEITGISRATISAAENGHREPNGTTLRLWGLATGVSADWLDGAAERRRSPEPGERFEASSCTPRDLNSEPTVSVSLGSDSDRRDRLAPVISIDSAPRFRVVAA